MMFAFGSGSDKNKTYTTVSGGSLGSQVDEERSKLRYTV